MEKDDVEMKYKLTIHNLTQEQAVMIAESLDSKFNPDVDEDE